MFMMRSHTLPANAQCADMRSPGWCQDQGLGQIRGRLTLSWSPAAKQAGPFIRAHRLGEGDCIGLCTDAEGVLVIAVCHPTLYCTYTTRHTPCQSSARAGRWRAGGRAGARRSAGRA